MPQNEEQGPWADYEPGGTAVAEEGPWQDYKAEAAPDLSRIKLSPYEEAVEARGGMKPPSGMESGKEFLTGVAAAGKAALAPLFAQRPPPEIPKSITPPAPAMQAGPMGFIPPPAMIAGKEMTPEKQEQIAEEAMSMSPLGGLQPAQGKTIGGQILAAPYNVALGAGKFLTSPMGVTAAMGGGGTAAKALWAGVMAKEAGTRLGGAQNLQDYLEGILGAGMAAGVGLHRALPYEPPRNLLDVLLREKPQLPRALAEALRTQQEKGALDATKERQQQADVQAEREGDGQIGAPAEAGVSGGVQPSPQVGGKVGEGEAGVKPAEVPQAGQARVLLSPEDQAYLESERKSIDREIEVGPEHLDENQPFAPNSVATINRKTGKVVINPEQFAGWLNDLRARGLSPKQIREAVRSTLGEEGIHLAVSDAMADEVWSQMTAFEKAIEHKLYTGEWSRGGAEARHGRKFSDRDIAHEAVRRRMQRLARMKSTEVAEVIGRERWSRQSLELMNDVVRRVRELIKRPTPEQAAIFDRIQANINQGIVAQGGQPAKLRTLTPAVRADENLDLKVTGQDHGSAKLAMARKHHTIPLQPQNEGFLDENGNWLTRKEAAAVFKEITGKDPDIADSLRSEDLKQEGLIKPAEPAALRRKAEEHEGVPEEDFYRVRAELSGESGVEGQADPFVPEGHGGILVDGEVIDDQAIQNAGAKIILYGYDQTRADLEKQINQFESFKDPEKYARFAPFKEELKGELRALKSLHGKVLQTDAEWHREHPNWKPEKPPPPPEDPNQLGLFGPEPGALRRRPESSEQGVMFLPPVPHGTPLEREGFGLPTIKAVNALANAHIQDKTQPPSLERFRGELQSQFGSNVKKDQVYYQWMDAIQNHLENAPGAEIDRLIDQLGLRGALSEEHQTSFAPGQITDPIDLGAQQRQFTELLKQFPHKKAGTPARFRQWFGPKLRKRYAAIGAIVNKLAEEAGPAPERSWKRPMIGPEDIAQAPRITVPSEKMVDPQTGAETFTQPEIETKPVWLTLQPGQAADPATVGQLLTSGARLSSKVPVSVTKNVLAVRDLNGKITLVGGWRDGRRGVVVTNPANPKGSSVKLDADFLKRYRPFVVMQLRDPVQDFHMTFGNQEEFDAYFGDVGIEGTEDIKTSSFAGPMAGTVRSQAGLTGAAAPPPAEAGLGALSEGEQPSKTARELTMPSYVRAGTPGKIEPGIPRPGPIPAEKIPGMAPEPPVTPHTPMVPQLPYEAKPTGPRTVTEYGKPAPRQPGTEYRAGLAPEVSRRAPAALRRGPVADEIQATKETLQEIVKNWPLVDRAAYEADNVGNKVNIYAAQQGWRARLASIVKPAGRMAQLTTPWQRGNPEVLSAANVLLQAGFDRSRIDRAQTVETEVEDAQGNITTVTSTIPSFMDLVKQGIARARARAASPFWQERKLAQAELRTGLMYLKELRYARDHWDDRELQNTATRIAHEYDRRLRELRRAGISVKHEAGFDPQRYDATLLNPKSFLGKMLHRQQQVLGTRTLDPRRYHSYYEAYGNGPFLPATRDSASLLEHYLRRTGTMLAREQWTDALKSMRTPAGLDFAQDAIQTPKGYRPHQVGYEVVQTGGTPLSVHPDYASLIRRLSDWRGLEDNPVLGGALRLSQALKHSILVGDFFHLGRVGYYGLGIMGTKAGFKSGWSVLDIGERDTAEAVRKGVIRQKDADWANEPVQYGTATITRRELAQKFYSEFGANLGRIEDALYKDLITTLSPTSGPLRRASVRVLDPSIGRYNRFLFDKLTRGIMAEANVREFERQMKKRPTANPDVIMRDIAKDVNNFFGNIGRQGWFKSKTMMDLARITFLAPQWVEGLVKKEAIAYSRLTGMSALAGARKGRLPLGTTGKAIGQSMLLMAGITQAINLITRHQPTWMNEEKGHKFDAWIPGWGADDEGFWLSPLAIFNELSHDVYRLLNSKPTAMDAFAQILGNKEQPVTRAVMTMITGYTPYGQKLTTSANRIGTSLAQMAPIPISFGRFGQAAGHAVAPGIIPPAPPGSIGRQIAATAGVKIEPKESDIAEISQKAQQWIKDEGLEKEKGWMQVQTDEPSYSKLRAAIRLKDEHGFVKMLNALRKTHTDDEIMKSMQRWNRGGFTGSRKNEEDFKSSLDEKGLELYDRAKEHKQMMFEDFLELFWKNS